MCVLWDVAKELHIKIDDVIGTLIDDEGYAYIGYMYWNFAGALESNPDAEKLVIQLDTPGGCTLEGSRIYNRMQQFKQDGGQIEIIGQTLVASMGTYLMQGASPGMRKLLNTTVWNGHFPWKVTVGDSEAHEKAARELNMLNDTFATVYSASNTKGLSREEILSDLKQDLRANAEYALERGYIDVIIDSVPVVAAKSRETASALAFYTPNPELINMANTAKAEDVSVLAKIKTLLGMDAATEAPGTGGSPEISAAAEEVPAPVALDTEAADGTKLRISGESIAVGANVYLITEEGEQGEAAPDGTYDLTTGEVITVADGVITEVEPAIEAQARKFTAQMTALQAQFQAVQKENATLKAKVAALPPAPDKGMSEKGQTQPTASGKPTHSSLGKVVEQIKAINKSK